MTQDGNKALNVSESNDEIVYRAEPDGRRDFMKVLGSVAGVGALAGCSGTGDGTNGTDNTENESSNNGETDTEKREKLIVALPAEPWNMDPALHTDAGSNYAQNIVYDEVIGLH